MREIKFKFWNSKNKKMIQNRHELGISANGKVSRLIGHDDYLEWEGTDLSEHVVSLQYIGIKDVHKKKVFSGDIVKVKQIIYKDCSREKVDWIEEYVGAIVWHQYGWMIATKSENGIHYTSLRLWDVEKHTMEVLGNIYESPELIKEGN